MMNFTDPANFISLNSTTTAAPIAAFSFKGSFWEPQPLPGWDLDNGFFRAWWIDPLVASVSFIVFISWYWYHERRIGVSSVVKLDWKALNFHDSMPVLTGVSYWAGIYLWRIIIPPAATQLPDGLPSNLSEFVHMLLEVASGIIAYDAIFFFIHWAFHAIPVLRRFHSTHHGRAGNASKENRHANVLLESRHVLRHSFVDASLQVLVNIYVQRSNLLLGCTIKSRLARAIHNILVIWFLTESHSAAPTPCIWRRWLVGVRQHKWHHLNETEHFLSGSPHRRERYQQFFGYLDEARWYMVDRLANWVTQEHPGSSEKPIGKKV